MTELESREEGTWFTDNPAGYQRRGGAKGKVERMINPDELNLAKEKDVWKLGNGDWKEGIKKVKEAGYDGVYQVADGDKNYLIFDINKTSKSGAAEQSTVGETKEESTFPKPAKPISQMTADEVVEHANVVRDYLKNQEVQFFGVEGAKKYKQAMAVTNKENPHTQEYKDAQKIVNDMEERLTEQQRNDFFGIGADDTYIYDRAELMQIAQSIRLIEGAENINDLSRSLKLPLLDFKRNSNDEGNMAIINAAKRKAEELGIDPKELIEKSVKNIISELSDPDDAIFLAKSIIEKLAKPMEVEQQKLPTNETNLPTPEGTQSKPSVQESPTTSAPIESSSQSKEGAAEPPKPPTEPPPTEKEESKPERLNDKGVLSHLYKAKDIPESARKGFEEEGLKYETKSQKEAEDVAKNVVEFAGLDQAVQMAEAQKFDGDVNSLIFAEALNKLAEQESQATTEEEKIDIAKKFAEIGITYDKMARVGGRFNAAINYFYKKSPLGIVMMENAKRKEDFDQWAKPKNKSWKEFFDEMMKEPEFEVIIKEQAKEELKKERAEGREKRIKKVSDAIDKAKDQFKGGAAYSTIIPPQVITAALEGIKRAYIAGEKVGKVIQDAIDYISSELGNAPWDKDKFRKEWEEKLKDKNLLSDEEVKAKVLEKFRKKLKGLSDKQKDELVSKAYKKLIENDALDYDDFKKMIAQVVGRADLTQEEVAKMKDLITKTNAVEDAGEKVRTERTKESLLNLRKTEIEAGRASKELSELFHDKPDIVRRLTSIMQLSTLGIPALVNNPVYNIWNQAALRFPIGIVNDAVDRVWSGIAKLRGKNYDKEYNVWETQAEFWNKLGLGGRESFKQLFTGLSRMDYTAKEISGQQIRPLKAWRDLIDHAMGKKTLTREKWWDKMIQGTVGIPAEAVARVLNLGDKPQRFAAEGAQASTFAKNLGLKGMDYKIFIEFPREEAYRAYKAQGLSDEVAGQKADAIKESIIKEGQRSTFQQDNLLNDALTRAFGVLGGKESGTSQLAKTLVVSPYIKIPTNAFWSLYNLINPEVAILQSLTHAGISKRFKSKGDLTKSKLQNREARYWMAHAIVGMAMRAVVIALVKQGTFVPASDEDDSKKERDADALFDKPGHVNAFGMKISNRWWGQFGMMGNAIAKKYKDATPEQREAQDDFWNTVLGKMEIEALNEMENGVFANSSSLLQTISTGNPDRYLMNTLNMMTNIIHPASVAQINRAALNEVPSSKGDSFLDKLNQNFAQRSTLYRKIFNVQLRQKRDIWGQKIPRGGNILSRMFGISKADPQIFGRPVYDDFIRTGDSGFLPPAVLPTLNGKKLNTEQEERLQEYIGSERKKIVEPYINNQAIIPIANKTYSQLPNDEKKKQVLEYLYSTGRESGVELFYKDYPEFRPKGKTTQDLIDDSLWEGAKGIMKTNKDK